MTRRYTIVLGAALGLALFVLTPARADACSFEGFEELELSTEAQQNDSQNPGAISSIGHSIKRGKGPESEGCSQSMTSCDDVGAISLDLIGAADDQTAANQLGYILELESGTLPGGLQLPQGPVRSPSGGSSMTLVWADEASDTQEAFDFTLMIFPVDLAGNVGEGKSVRIADEGSEMACSVGSNATNRGLIWGLLLFGIFVTGRAMRRRAA